MIRPNKKNQHFFIVPQMQHSYCSVYLLLSPQGVPLLPIKWSLLPKKAAMQRSKPKKDILLESKIIKILHTYRDKKN